MTTATSQRDIEDLRLEIARLEGRSVLLATSAGTYGAEEAARRMGTGDPAFADRNEYENVRGQRWATGPSPDRAPGRMRDFRATQYVVLKTLRAQLAGMRDELAAMERRRR